MKKTNDYSLFNLISHNREIKPKKVERLIASFKKIGYIKARPILVNSFHRMQIIDGQHRLEAARKLGIEVWYDENDSDASADVVMQQLNLNQNGWDLRDWVHKYSVMGNTFHRAVTIFQEMHALGITNSLTICAGGHYDAKLVREGREIKLNPHRDKTAEFLLEMRKVLPYYSHSKFVLAVTLLMKHPKMKKEYVAKLKKRITSIPQQALTAGYMNSFENIINNHLPPEKQIRLS